MVVKGNRLVMNVVLERWQHCRSVLPFFLFWRVCVCYKNGQQSKEEKGNGFFFFFSSLTRLRERKREEKGRRNGTLRKREKNKEEKEVVSCMLLTPSTFPPTCQLAIYRDGRDFSYHFSFNTQLRLGRSSSQLHRDASHD